MVNTLRVMLWDEEIGRLAWDNRRRLSYFTYNPEFLKKGIDISPLQAPVRGIRTMTPVWGEDARMYQKLPAFLADSLPDAWGNQLFELWRIQNHIPNADITPLINFLLSVSEAWVHWNSYQRWQRRIRQK